MPYFRANTKYTGKSTICSRLVRYAETENISVFYYFCTYLGDSCEGPSRLLRSLVSQIIQKHQDLAIHVHDVYLKSHPMPSKKALLGLLSELISGLHSVRLVVDGIDEWNSRDQKDLLKDMTQILSTDRASYICKILFASRDTMDISRILLKKGKAAVTISLSDNDESHSVSRSIGNFVDEKLSDLPEHIDDLDPDSSVMTQIKKTLLEKSQGKFCFVVFLFIDADPQKVCSYGYVLYSNHLVPYTVPRNYELFSTICRPTWKSCTNVF
jgi:hypothetical protein